jgi:hypothetical protein
MSIGFSLTSSGAITAQMNNLFDYSVDLDVTDLAVFTLEFAKKCIEIGKILNQSEARIDDLIKEILTCKVFLLLIFFYGV